jgi:hypothetical protein
MTYKENTIDYINSKYVVHFLAGISEKENTEYDKYGIDKINKLYMLACNKAYDFSGKKFHNKQYGGGIAFNNLEDCKNFIDSAN